MATDKELLQKLTHTLAANANATNVKAMEAYMKNLFPMLGIKKPERTALTKALLKEYAQLPPSKYASITKQLWKLPEREYQYFCLDLLEKYKKHWDEDFIDTLEWLIVTKSWWDTVDLIASHLVGLHLKRFPHQRDAIIEKWRNSDNMWLNRTAILFQLQYKQTTDQKLLFSIAEQHKASNEFFIQKAIGWALREYSYTNADAVTKYVAKAKLKPLSSREALKAINRTNVAII